MTIIEEIRANPESGARRLMAEYSARLHAAALNLCGDGATADDLVVRALDRAVRKIDSCRDSEALFGWIYAIMLNLYRDEARTLSSQRTVYCENVPEVASEMPSLGRGIDDAILRAAIKQLPREMRDAIVMHYFMDLSVAQMAKVLMVPAGTVKSRLHYARLCLGGILEMKGIRNFTILLVAGLFAGVCWWFGARSFSRAGSAAAVPAAVAESQSWLSPAMTLLAENRSLTTVGGVEATVQACSRRFAEARVAPEVLNDGAVLSATCEVTVDGSRFSANVLLMQVGSDIWGCVSEPTADNLRVTLVARRPSRSGEIAVCSLRLLPGTECAAGVIACVAGGGR